MKGRLLSRKGTSSSSRVRRAVYGRSVSQERSTAKALGGARVSGSGNLWHSKSDVKTDTFLVECKRTDKASYTIKLEELVKNMVEAMRAGKNPMVQVEFGKKRFAIIPWDTLLDLLAQSEVDDVASEED